MGPRPDPRKLIYISNIYWYISTYLPHISTYFNVYLYLFSYIFILISTYIYLYLYIFTAILNIFTHNSTHFHVYLYLFSCIFLLISIYLLLFSTCRALHLLLPASGTTCLDPIPTIVCYFTTVYHKSVVLYNK